MLRPCELHGEAIGIVTRSTLTRRPGWLLKSKPKLSTRRKCLEEQSCSSSVGTQSCSLGVPKQSPVPGILAPLALGSMKSWTCWGHEIHGLSATSRSGENLGSLFVEASLFAKWIGWAVDLPWLKSLAPFPERLLCCGYGLWDSWRSLAAEFECGKAGQQTLDLAWLTNTSISPSLPGWRILFPCTD